MPSYGTWKRCGGSSFWKRASGPGQLVDLYVDPVDGLYITWREIEPYVIELEIARIPAHVPTIQMVEAIQKLQEPMSRFLRAWMRHLSSLVFEGRSKKDMLASFLELEEVPTGRIPKEQSTPTREMILSGVMRLIESLWGETQHEKRTVPIEEAIEVFKIFGMNECWNL